MKGVIVFYMAVSSISSKAELAKRKDDIETNLEEMRNKEIGKDFHFLVIEDPDRDKSEVQVFFKPK
jgi:hypothetical protein